MIRVGLQKVNVIQSNVTKSDANIIVCVHVCVFVFKHVLPTLWGHLLTHHTLGPHLPYGDKM